MQEKHSTFGYSLNIVSSKSVKMQLILAAMVEENKTLGMPCSSELSYASDFCCVQQHSNTACLPHNGTAKSHNQQTSNTTKSSEFNKKATDSSSRPEANRKVLTEACNSQSLSRKDFKVFLGGSCNPTTWRYDDAIPELEKLNIKYYNPQVPGNWGEDLMKEERQAKANAEVLFFVIDSQTRSVASMVEAAHIAGSARKLVLVIKEFKNTAGIRILDEDVSERETKYLKKGRSFLWSLVENAGYPVCEDIPTALYCTACIVWLNVRAQDLRLKATPSEVERISEHLGSTSIRTSLLKNISGLKPSQTKEIGLTAREGPKLTEVMTKIFLSAPVVQTVTKFLDWMLPQPEWCVYLGGSGNPSTWRDDVILMLRKHNINYISKENSEDDKPVLPDSLLRNKRKIMLFVITKDTRALAAMMMAAYCVGLGLKVVLCIQYLEDGVVIDGEELTPCAVKDYNRGRIYLRDLAEEANVPIFGDVSEAANFVVSQCNSKSAETS